MISIVIPLYNKKKSITATLQSVIAQTYTDWECIVINDGSTDNSLEVVKNFVDKFRILNFLSQGNDYCKFQILSKPNGGVSSARNAGIIAAKGEYIAFLDGDDIWEGDYLETLARLINDYPKSVLYGLGYGWIRNGEKVSVTGTLNNRGIIPNDGSGLMQYWTSSSSSSRAALIRAGLFNENLTHGEDLDMWWRLMQIGQSVFDSHECAYYVQDAENRAMAKMPPINKHVVSIISQYAEIRKNNAAFRKAFDTQMIYFLYEYMFTPYRKEAQRLARQLDYSQLKFSLRFRMQCPHIYRCLTGR